MNITPDSRRLRNALAPVVFVCLTALYWTTTPTSVSYWDCPEYVAAASLLEVGHPPGNPTWMLIERIITMPAPPDKYAYAINLSGGVFTAGAATLLYLVIFNIAWWITRPIKKHRPGKWAIAVSATAGAIAFGVCDSTWYSAVEAEVYAMSIFFTALCVWLMVKWAFTRNPQRANRLLVLLAYIFGLSIGIHQLNLLCIPALALIWGLRKGVRSYLKLGIMILLGCILVGCILMSMMPSAIALAADIELLCVNYLHLPKLSGVVLYLLLLGGALLLALFATSRSHNRGLVAAASFPAIFLSGLFSFGANWVVGLTVSALVTIILVRPNHFDVRRLNLAFWMLAMLLTGYSAYALIPVRGNIPSPANPNLPGNPFSFAAYQAREQYGSAPLFYGTTPYSKPLFEENYDKSGNPVYLHYALINTGPKIVPEEQDGAQELGLITLLNGDSSLNAASAGEGYVIRGYRVKNVYTPELNIWFPRITSRNPADITSYSDWAGMDRSNMQRVEVSEALDSNGRAVGRMVAGKREKSLSYRPTQMQNFRFFFSYQIGYMYLRYLMWNFSGRQNDIPSQGEVNHGNFITGYPILDNAMLGAEESLPPSAGSENPGRNRYFMLPLLLGIAGLIMLFIFGLRSRAVGYVTLLLFFMTGIAIVIYLNQSPGEPRERDYSFLGSFWTFAFWIGISGIGLARLCRTDWAALFPLGVAVYMGITNFDDHDRRGRNVAEAIARTTLESLAPDAILFVDGDNFTFPLWYAQEVLGVRRDVRVINMSYLSLSEYAANLLDPWRESTPLPSVLKRPGIVYGSYASLRLPNPDSPIRPAREILDSLVNSPRNVLISDKALLSDGEAVINLRKMAGSASINFRRLMLFNLIASNDALANPRPVYFANSLKSSGRIPELDILTYPTLLNRRFRPCINEDTDSLMLEETEKSLSAFVHPISFSKRVYLDYTPARMIGNYRGAIIDASFRLLHGDRLNAALEGAYKADTPLGSNHLSWPNMRITDSIANIRLHLASLLMDIADTLQHRLPEMTPGEARIAKAKILELKARSRFHQARVREENEAQLLYRHNLPERLRPMISSH